MLSAVRKPLGLISVSRTLQWRVVNVRYKAMRDGILVESKSLCEIA